MKTSLLFVVFALLPSLALAASSQTAASPTATPPAASSPAATSQTTSHPTTTSPTVTDANSTLPNPTEELKVMTERLKLSPSQQAAIKPILVAELDQTKAIQDNTKLTAQQKHDQTGTVHRAALQKIKALFTPAQMTQIEQEQDNPPPSPTNTTATKSK